MWRGNWVRSGVLERWRVSMRIVRLGLVGGCTGEVRRSHAKGVRAGIASSSREVQFFHFNPAADVREAMAWLLGSFREGVPSRISTSTTSFVLEAMSQKR